jgi:hypothetical protein
VIGVVVTEEDLTEGKPDTVPHHLALIPFPAIEEEGLAFALYRQTADVPVNGRRGSCGAEEGDA